MGYTVVADGWVVRCEVLFALIGDSRAVRPAFAMIGFSVTTALPTLARAIAGAGPVLYTRARAA